MLRMKKVIVLRHQHEMKFSREFFQLKIPKELSVIIYLIVAVCFVTISVVLFGQIDDVIKTSGFVRTKENVSSVRNVIAGKIVELNYNPGQKVSKDDVLFKIDSTEYEAQKNILVRQNDDIQKKIVGLRDLCESYKCNVNLCDVSDSLSYSRFEAYLKNKEVLEIKVQLAQKEYNYENQKPESLKNPFETEMQFQSYCLAAAELESYKRNFISGINSELNEKLLAAYDLQQSITKLDNQNIFLEVKSPVNGYVQELSSLNVGDYLESNSKVLNIVPNDNKNFRVEIQISPKDMGKIAVNQKVKYRLSAFPFYEYKGAEGVITSIDPDIRTSSDGKNVYYSVYADIDRTEFSNKRGETFPVRAGLETDARIVLERKPIIYYVLKKLDFLN